MNFYEWLNNQTMKCENCDEDHPLSEEIKERVKAQVEVIKLKHPEVTDQDLIEGIGEALDMAKYKPKKPGQS